MDKPKQTRPKPAPKPQTIDHVKLKDALKDQAFLNWVKTRVLRKSILKCRVCPRRRSSIKPNARSLAGLPDTRTGPLDNR